MSDIDKKLEQFGIAPVLTDLKPYVDNYFGGCPECGETDSYLNVYSTQVFRCDRHKTCWVIGKNVFSDWRSENEDIWEANGRKLIGYRKVEPLPCSDYELGAHGQITTPQRTRPRTRHGLIRRHAERGKLKDPKCGARTCRRLPCKAQGSGRCGRCRNHGGVSTGPRTVGGRRRISEAQRQRWARWRTERISRV